MSPPLIDPPAGQWAGLIRRFAPNARSALFRRQLALPDGPLILIGHQAEFWHAGVVAKWLAAAAAAAAAPAGWAWLVVDHDTNNPWRIRLPWRGRDGKLAVKVWDLDPAGSTRTQPTAHRPALPHPAPVPADSGEGPALACVREGAEAILAVLRARTGVGSAAVQVTAATVDLLRPLAAPAATIMSSALSGTDLFAELASRAAADPERCARAYNAAAAAHPRARVRPLMRDAARGWELPWWASLAPERTPAFASDLARAEPRTLAPRALLMTGLLRLAGCDLFIHGLGGGRYDAITDRWFHEWLGESLAPAVVVSATCLLPFDRLQIPDPARIAWLRHAAHAAAHNPARLGDAEPAARKQALVARIAAEKRQGRRPIEAYRALHSLLAEYRARHADRLEAMRAEAALAADRLGEASIVHDRTWAFPLHGRESLASLQASIDAAFEA